MVSLILGFLLQHPNIAAQAGKSLPPPRKVDTAVMQASFADMAKEVLGCYHHTARYVVADVVQKPWDRQTQYGASQSALVRISYKGLSGIPFQMTVAILNKDQSVRTAVLNDTATVPYNKKCQLEQWTGA